MENEMVRHAKTAPKFRPHKWKIGDTTLSIQTIPLMIPTRELPKNRCSSKSLPNHTTYDCAYSTHIHRFKIYPHKGKPLAFDLYSVNLSSLPRFINNYGIESKFNVHYQEYCAIINQNQEYLKEQTEKLSDFKKRCGADAYVPDLAIKIHQFESSLLDFAEQIASAKAAFPSEQDLLIGKWSYDARPEDTEEMEVSGSSMSLSYRARFGEVKSNFTPWKLCIENYTLSRTPNNLFVKKNIQKRCVLLSAEIFEEVQDTLNTDYYNLLYLRS